MSLIKSAGKLFAANVIRSLLGFVGIILFARILGATELGFYFLFQALLGMCAIPADFGINSALKKRVSEGNERNEYLTSAILLKFITICVVSGIILLFENEVNNYIGAPLAVYLIFGLFTQQYSQLMINTLHGELRVGETASIELVEQFIWLGFGIFLILEGYGVVGLVYAFLAAQGIKFLIAWWRSNTQFGIPRRKHFTSVFDYSKFSVISSIGGYAYSWVDILIIGFFLTASHVGAYEIAWRISGLVLLFSRSVGKTVFPQISEWSNDDFNQKIRRLVPKATTATLVISIPAFFGTLLFSTEILEIFFGQEYLLASTALVILMFEKIPQSVHKIWGYSLQAIDRPDLAAAATTISLATNVILNLLFVPMFGLTGAACATALSFVLNTSLHGYYLSRSVPLTLEYEKIAWCVLASIGMTSILFSIQGTANISSEFTLIGIVTVGALIYFSFIVLYNPLRKDILSIIDSTTLGNGPN